MATDEARYAGTESRPCTFAAEDLLPDSRLHASLAYCALNGRTLPSTRINAVSPPSPSAAKRFRERGKAVCTNFNCSSSPLCLRLLFILPDSLSLYSCTGENLNFFFCSSFFPLQLLKQGPVSNCYCSFIRTNRGSGYDRYILYSYNMTVNEIPLSSILLNFHVNFHIILSSNSNCIEQINPNRHSCFCSSRSIHQEYSLNKW